MTGDGQGRKIVDDPPPVLGTWRRVYLAVVIYLITIIAAFWAFGRAAAP